MHFYAASDNLFNKLVSPQRFANENETAVAEEEISGRWERIYFGYTVVPGFASEQLMPDMQA